MTFPFIWNPLRLLGWRGPLVTLGLLLFGVPVGLAQAELEYLGHACFLVRSPAGVRVVIDPFNGDRWLGYHFPEGVQADAVLISHPHYDHDAAYYLDPSAPVFRRPGSYAAGDVRITGVEGAHAEPYGADFDRSNVVWLLEVGGLRIAHWGDNGPLTDALKAQLGRLDIVLLPIDSTFHILKADQIEQILKAFAPVVVVPMHYRLPLAPELQDLGPIDPFLERGDARRLNSHQVTFIREGLPAENQIVALQASPAIRPWEETLKQAWQEAGKARQAMASGDQEGPAQAFGHIQKAVELAPGVIVFQWGLAQALSQAGRRDEAIPILERALAAGQQDDWEYRMRSHLLLARLYQQRGDLQPAADHYRIVLKNSFRPALREPARQFFEEQ